MVRAEPVLLSDGVAGRAPVELAAPNLGTIGRLSLGVAKRDVDGRERDESSVVLAGDEAEAAAGEDTNMAAGAAVVETNAAGFATPVVSTNEALERCDVIILTRASTALCRRCAISRSRLSRSACNRRICSIVVSSSSFIC